MTIYKIYNDILFNTIYNTETLHIQVVRIRFTMWEIPFYVPYPLAVDENGSKTDIFRI